NGASFAPGDWQCGMLAFPQGLSWTINPISSTVVTLGPFGLTDGIHTCLGTVVVSWSNPGQLVFSSTYVPADVGSPGPCYVTGTLSSVPTLSIY
ncbi:MAG: protein activator of alkane oxidation PraB, partial [Caulobacter sp.]